MYSLEFETVGRTRMMSVRFWKDDNLVRVQVHRCLLTQGIASNYFSGASRLLSVVSSKPKLVSVSGCSAPIVQTFDNCEELSFGVQYPFRFDVFSLSTLMHQSDSNVFGTIDIFSQLKFLVVTLRGVLDQPWTVNAPELTKVTHTYYSRSSGGEDPI